MVSQLSSRRLVCCSRRRLYTPITNVRGEPNLPLLRLTLSSQTGLSLLVAALLVAPAMLTSALHNKSGCNDSDTRLSWRCRHSIGFNCTSTHLIIPTCKMPLHPHPCMRLQATAFHLHPYTLVLTASSLQALKHPFTPMQQHLTQTSTHQFQNSSGYCAQPVPHVRNTCLFSHVGSPLFFSGHGGQHVLAVM